MFLTTLGLLAAALAPAVSGHSWNEQLSLIDGQGKYIANGYPRGYVARADPGFNGNSMMWMLPSAESKRTRIDNTDSVCHTSQRTKTNAPQYPRLQVTPGSTIAMKYLENGHVTNPLGQKGKQLSGGSVFVFGTKQPKDDAKIMDVMQWTADGQGGDKSGVLIAAQNYDDGRCYQISGTPISTQRQQQTPNHKPGQTGGQSEELWCTTYVTMPKDLPQGQGSYTLYWVWDWRTLDQQQAASIGGGQSPDPGIPKGKDEFYTTCSDFDVVAQPPAPAADKNTLGQQDPMSTAAPNFLSSIMGAKVKSPAEEPAPVYATAGAGGSPQPTPPAPAAPSQAPAGTTPAVVSMISAQPGPAAPQPTGAAPAPSSVQPLGLSNFKPAPASAAAANSGVPSAAPTPASAAAANSGVPSAAPTPASSGAPTVVTIPAGAGPVYMIQNGSLQPLHKRAEPTDAPSSQTTFAKVARSVHHHTHSHHL